MNMNKPTKNIYSCRASTSMSSLVGNASLVVKNYFLTIFPKNTFKKVFIDMGAASNEFMDSKSNTFAKEGFPMLSIRPTIQFNDDTVFGRLPDWMCTNYFTFTNPHGNYKPVFADQENRVYIFTSPDRIKITFEIEIICASKMQQMNLAHYLKANALHKGYFYLNDIKLEAEVPRLYIDCLFNELFAANEDQKDKQEVYLEFTDYLESHSQSYITEKYNPSSANSSETIGGNITKPSYHYLYGSNLLMMFEDYPSMDDGEQVGQMKTNFRVNDTLSCEFWAPSNFFFETSLPLNTGEYTPGWDVDELLGNKVNLTYTMQLKPDKFVNVDGNTFDYVKKQGYITEDVPLDKDTINLYNFIHSEIRDTVKYIQTHDPSLTLHYKESDLILFRLYEGDNMKNPDQIQLDWDTLDMTHIEPKSNTTYHLFMYINYEKYNKLRKLINKRENKNYID